MCVCVFTVTIGPPIGTITRSSHLLSASPCLFPLSFLQTHERAFYLHTFIYNFEAWLTSFLCDVFLQRQSVFYLFLIQMCI